MIMHSSCTDVLRQPCTVHAQKVNAKHEFREEFMGEKERLIVDKENISQDSYFSGLWELVVFE